MTTCSVGECRNEGVLLLHIRHKKENLVQAEYCPHHFCTLSQQWREDIDLATRYTRRLYHYISAGEDHYGRTNESVVETLKYIWRVKGELPRHTPFEEVIVRIENIQTQIFERIRKREDFVEEKYGFPRRYTSRQEPPQSQPQPSQLQ